MLQSLGRGTGLLVVLAAVFASPVMTAEPSSRPNVVLIMCDDVGYECVGANGGESYATPRLDALAAAGMRFTQCHVQPLCTPNRVELMTGRSNVRNYVDFGVLPPGETTFGNLFAAAGYVTGICGKWQLGREPDLPRRAGFAEAFLWQHTRPPPHYANPRLEIDGVERDFPGGGYGPTLVNDFALDFLARHRDRPFFLYYPMILAHDPFQPTPDSPDWDPQAEGERSRGCRCHLAGRSLRHPAPGDCFVFVMAAHENMHLGQLSAWRRAQGMGRV